MNLTTSIEQAKKLGEFLLEMSAKNNEINRGKSQFTQPGICKITARWSSSFPYERKIFGTMRTVKAKPIHCAIKVRAGDAWKRAPGRGPKEVRGGASRHP